MNQTSSTYLAYKYTYSHYSCAGGLLRGVRRGCAFHGLLLSHLDKLADVLENVFHVEDRVTGCPLTAGLGGTYTFEVAGHAGAVQVPVIDQEEHEGSAALPSKHASKR